MIYKKGNINKWGELVFSDEKEINQEDLTADCFLIQFNGLEACKECDLENTDDCGGGETLKKLKGMENLRKIKNKDHHQDLESFIDDCKDGSYIDSDGHGYLATKTHYDIVEQVHPSDLLCDDYNKSFSHIVWFNK